MKLLTSDWLTDNQFSPRGRVPWVVSVVWQFFIRGLSNARFKRWCVCTCSQRDTTTLSCAIKKDMKGKQEPAKEASTGVNDQSKQPDDSAYMLFRWFFSLYFVVFFIVFGIECFFDAGRYTKFFTFTFFFNIIILSGRGPPFLRFCVLAFLRSFRSFSSRVPCVKQLYFF